MKLYDYFRSSCSYRVRIALNIKNVQYDVIPVHLVNNGGEQHSDSYRAINPQELVPSLETNDGIINQSLAIIDYLDEIHPEPKFLPLDSFYRAQVRSLALIIACEVHPLNNLRVLQTLVKELKVSDEQKISWYHKWLKNGFDSFELQLSKLPREKLVCFGDKITLADICLIPQVYNAKRFDFSLNDYPLISDINDYCLTLPEFKKAEP
ncbi:MAG: maleylacetoacetate isomerase [Legionellaceae bacterium]|nr:maleylacetoacetate isomerase [Legionellaceae bacterium]